MSIKFLTEIFYHNSSNTAIVWKDKIFSYGWLLDRVKYWIEEIKKKEIKPGSVAVVEADFSPNSVSLMLALIDHNCIFVPITKSVANKKKDFIKISQAEVLFFIDDNDIAEISFLDNISNSNYYIQLRALNHPGLVLFSSGSTGVSKGSVHDVIKIFKKFKVKRHRLSAISFLLYDHIGGFNTLLYILSNAGKLVTIQDRSPDSVLSIVEKYKVELLPTSPTFINLILYSEAYKRHSLKSLKTITYGTEPMPESTLKKFNSLFPQIKLLQTYGLSEVGILRSKSKSSDSLWVKVGGEGFKTRVVDGMLEIKADSAMLGYLNAKSPFTEDGWFKTMDAVELDGEYLKIKGRKSEIINVGGEKVYPQEVEDKILEIEEVLEAKVFSEKNIIMGNIICAEINAKINMEPKDIKKKVIAHCRNSLAPFMVPVKVIVSNQNQHSSRFKKKR